MGQADPRAQAKDRLSRDIPAKNLRPLWERAADAAGPAPALWRYAEVRDALFWAADVITARDAERRVLMLENPSLPGTGFVGRTLFAGMQLVLPGETVPAHRHTPNALRFIIEGTGAYTTVGGRRVSMAPGDFIVTPAWMWHDHGNDGAKPAIWMDGLDLPFARFFGAHFRERRSATSETVGQRTPSDLVYPYQSMYERLEALAGGSEPHASHGYELRYLDAQGADPIGTLAAFMTWLPAGFAGAEYRSTETRVFNVAEGSGEASIADSSYRFGRHDVFVVPSWTPYRLHAQTRSLLFSYSDRTAQERLGFYRESLATARS